MVEAIPGSAAFRVSAPRPRCNPRMTNWNAAWHPDGRIVL
jgi:hypothetical protein